MFRQSCLDEFDYTIKNLCVDLRDGVRLVRLAEIWTTHSSGAKQILDTSLSQKLRLPTVSRLQKIHNVKLALERFSLLESVWLDRIAGRSLPSKLLMGRPVPL